MNNDSIAKAGRQVSAHLLHSQNRNPRAKAAASKEVSETNEDAVKRSAIPEVVSVSRSPRIDSVAVAQALAGSLATYIREQKTAAEDAHSITSESLKLLS